VDAVYAFIVELNHGFGAIIVAVITLLGTWIINKYNNNSSLQLFEQINIA